MNILQRDNLVASCHWSLSFGSYRGLKSQFVENFGGVIDKRVNTAETHHKAFPIFGRSLASSRTIIQTCWVSRSFAVFVIPRLRDTTGCQYGCTTGSVWQTSCQTGCTTSLTTGCIHDTAGCQTDCQTGWIFVYTVQPVIKPDWQQVISCRRGFMLLSGPLRPVHSLNLSLRVATGKAC